MTDTADRRDITDAERPWIEHLDTLERLDALRRQLIAAGESPATAAGIVAWLNAKRLGPIDDTTAMTRSRYRRILRGLGAPTKPKKGRRQAGFVHPQVMAGVTTIAGAAAALPVSAPGAAVALAAGLYVTKTGSDDAASDDHIAATSADVVELCARDVHTGTADVRDLCAAA